MMGHDARPAHDGRHPVQVTLRAIRGAPSLRSRVVFPVVARALGRARKERFRVVHFSVQQDHVHLIVEAEERTVLQRGVQGLAIRVALAVNRITGRRGKLWGDRYHGRALATPREVRASMVYVLLNFRKHLRAAAGIDPCSSGRVFSGWKHAPTETGGRPGWVARPTTWLGRIGWLRAGGPLSTCEQPSVARVRDRAGVGVITSPGLRSMAVTLASVRSALDP